MNRAHHLQSEIKAVETQIHYSFKNKELIGLALIHRSYANESRKLVAGHNERLEFLGDAILGLMVSHFLYKKFPGLPEGKLTYLRSRLVEASACAQYVREVGLEPYIKIGHGESMNQGKGRETILADFFEALIAALYLDGGIEAARDFFFTHFERCIFEIIAKPQRNWKAEIQEHCQKKYQTHPTYQLISAEGPDHQKVFHVQLMLHSNCLGEGRGHSRKEAEQRAAQQAMQQVEE